MAKYRVKWRKIPWLVYVAVPALMDLWPQLKDEAREFFLNNQMARMAAQILDEILRDVVKRKD